MNEPMNFRRDRSSNHRIESIKIFSLGGGFKKTPYIRYGTSNIFKW